MTRFVDGFVGNFNSVADLTAKYPPSEYSGASANIVVGNGSTKYLSNGSSWNQVNAQALEALVSGDGIKILPSGDAAGVTDRLTLEAAIASLPASGGRITMGAGQWYFASKDVATTNTDPGPLLRAGVHVTGEGHRAAKLRVVGGSKCNLFVADGVDGWSVTNLYLDGNRTDPAMPITANSADNLRNCIRVKNSADWRVADCTLTRAAYHGLIGVGSVRNARFEGNDCLLNGFRPVHIHDEGGSTPDIISVTGNMCDQNGQGIFPALDVTGTVQAGALTKLRVTAADAARLGQIYAASITTVLVSIPGAGSAGSTHFSAATLSASNPDGSNDLTLTLPAAQAAGPAVCRILAEQTSGIFVAYGCRRVDVSRNIIVGETAQGIAVMGSATATQAELTIHGNIVSGCGFGLMLGSNNGNETADITATGNVVSESLFEGVVVNNVRTLLWDGHITNSGLAGVRLVTTGTAMEHIRIAGTIRRCGAAGIYARGGGELESLTVTAEISDCGLNAGFTSSATNMYSTSSLGMGQGVLVSPDSSGKYHSVVVDSPMIRRCTNGAAHISSCDHAVTRITNALDNVLSTGGAAIAVRHNACLGGGVMDTNVRLRARTNSDYAVSITGCTDSVLRGNRSNYTRATNIYYVAGTNCTAWDNIGPAGTSVQFGAGGAAASDAAMQRVA